MRKNNRSLWRWILFVMLVCVSGAEARGIKEFSHPAWIGSSTSVIRITKVEFTDTATILSFHEQFTPGYWIKVSKDSRLSGDDNREYKALRGEGIVLGEEFVTPPSGEGDFKILYEPMPRNTRFFDFIGGNAEGSFLIYGVHEEGKAPKMPKKGDTFAMTPELEREFFKADTACVKGRIEGYSRSQGYSNMQFTRSNAMTSEREPIMVNIQEDGTFEFRFMAYHPTKGTLYIQRKDGERFTPFYAIPGQTSELVLKADGTVVYTSYPSGPFACKRFLEHDISSLCTYPYKEYASDAARFGFKDFIDNAMKIMQKRLDLVDYAAWRFGYTLWEKHLAECGTRLQHGRKVYDYEMDKKFEIMKGMTQEEYDEKMKPLRAPSSYYFMREMPCNDVSCLALPDFDYFMNRYQYSPVMRSFNGYVVYMFADSVAKNDAAKVARENMVLGTDKLSFFGCLAMLRELSDDLNNEYCDYPSYCDSVYDNRLAYMDCEALHVQGRRLLEKARRRSSLIYALPDTEGGELFRSLTEKYKGKYLLVDFWGIGCGPCRSGIEHSKKMREALRNHPDVDFLFISKEGEGSEELYRKYVDENLKGEDVIRVSNDDFNLLMELFEFLGIPHYETLDRKGNVVRKGLRYDSEEIFLHWLNDLKSKLEN